jgi:hypothetical protein
MESKGTFLKTLAIAGVMLIWLATQSACQSNPSGTERSASKNGVKLTITKVAYSDKDTILTYLIQVDPKWNLDVNAFPPQQAISNNPILINDKGEKYEPKSVTSGLPQADEATGGVKYESRVTFPPLQASNLTFQTEIEISEIPISPPVSVSVANHQVSDVWSIGQDLSFDNFVGIPVQVRLLSQNDQMIELEFNYDLVKSKNLKLECLTFYPDNWETTNSYMGCALDDAKGSSTSQVFLQKDNTRSILFHVTGSVAFTEPFAMSWATTKK